MQFLSITDYKEITSQICFHQFLLYIEVLIGKYVYDDYKRLLNIKLVYC